MSSVGQLIYIYIYIYIYIKNKSKATFTKFDIIEFYLSITKTTLIDSSNYARKYVEITEEQYKIILACRKTVPKNNRPTCVKTGSENFDVPVGRGMIFHKKQILWVYLYLIYLVGSLARKRWVYIIDGIIYIPNSNGPNSLRIQKKVIRAFEFLGFKI